MAIRLADIKRCIKNNDKTDVAVAMQPETHQETGEAAPLLDDSQRLLLEAQKNAEFAKEAAEKALSRFYDESQVAKKKVETLVDTFDKATQCAIGTINNSGKIVSNKNDVQASQENGQSSALPYNDKSVKSGLVKKILNNGYRPINTISEIAKSLFGSKVIVLETREDFYNLVMQQSPQLRQLIDDLTEEKAQQKAEKIIEQAKSDRIASKLAVSQAQEEIKNAREEAEMAKRAAEEAISRAQEEARSAREEAGESRRDAEEAINIAKEWKKQAQDEVATEKKAADLIKSQAELQALNRTSEEIKKAEEEVKAAKEAASLIIMRAEEEIGKSREEAEAANNRAEVVTALAQEKVKKDAEEIKDIKQQSKIAISQAQAEAKKAREEAEIARQDSQEAINRARTESQKEREEAERVKKEAQESIGQAEQQAYARVREELGIVKEEAEIAKQEAIEAVSKAQEEAQRAMEDAEMIKRASEEAIFKANEQSRKAMEEAEKAEQLASEAVAKAQEESRKAKEEAESSILMANQAMRQAKQDIIGITMKEISKTRQEIESASKYRGTKLDMMPEAGIETAEHSGQSCKVDSNYIAAVLHEMRAPLHSISGFARLMLEDDITDGMTRKEFLSILVQQSESLARLLDDFSSTLEPNSEKFNINKAPVSPHKLIAEAVQSAQGMDLQKKCNQL